MNITAWTTFETPEQRLIGEASRKVVTAITARNFKAPLKWVEEPGGARIWFQSARTRDATSLLFITGKANSSPCRVKVLP